MVSQNKKNIDVLIVCALKDEFDQLLSITEGSVEGEWKRETLTDGRLVSDVTFIGKDGREFSVRATWSSFMGREEASALVHSLLINDSYNCIAMTGICAGRRGKVSLGDVIFADRLWSYDAGKLVRENGVDKFQGDILQYRPNRITVQRMQSLSAFPAEWPLLRPKLPLEHQENWVIQCLSQGTTPSNSEAFDEKCPDWKETLQNLLDKKLVTRALELTELGIKKSQEIDLWYPKGLPEPEPFKIHVAPIGTGAAVVEDEGIFPKLSEAMRKVLGIDMEASALGAIGEVHNIPVIVAKAISDFGDKYKDDRYRHFASQASGQCMIKFLKENSDLFTLNKVNREDIVVSDEQLITFLSEEYPDVSDARSLWKKAGGKNGDITNIPRPRDMWQSIWQMSINGATVTPAILLNEVSKEYPNNKLIQGYLNQLQTNFR